MIPTQNPDDCYDAAKKCYERATKIRSDLRLAQVGHDPRVMLSEWLKSTDDAETFILKLAEASLNEHLGTASDRDMTRAYFMGIIEGAAIMQASTFGFLVAVSLGGEGPLGIYLNQAPEKVDAILGIITEAGDAVLKAKGAVTTPRRVGKLVEELRVGTSFPLSTRTSLEEATSDDEEESDEEEEEDEDDE